VVVWPTVDGDEGDGGSNDNDDIDGGAGEVVVWPTVDGDEGDGGGDDNDDIDGGAGEMVMAVVVVAWKVVVVARDGEWCGGSYRSGGGECFWGSPEKFSGGGGGGGRR
nr:hypothetical protein [Tanacetum cinerariifolium]